MNKKQEYDATDEILLNGFYEKCIQEFRRINREYETKRHNFKLDEFEIFLIQKLYKQEQPIASIKTMFDNDVMSCGCSIRYKKKLKEIMDGVNKS